MPNAHLLIVAGDASADRHGAALIEALRQQAPNLRLSAIGGSHLRSVADTFVYPLVDVGGFGFWEPLLKLPQLWKVKQLIQHLLVQDPPNLVIPMDYYGFNIHVARWAHARKVPVVYYISPQVWASRSSRVKELAAVVRKMLVIFPFEAALYRNAGVPVSFVGHPLLERMPAPATASEEATLGLLPGSRRSTILRHLPLLVETAKQLKERLPKTQVILFRPVEIEASFYEPYLKDVPWIQLDTDPDYEKRKCLWLALGVSGTAALENMLLGIPMMIMYRLSPLTYWIAKRLIRVPYIGIPNLLAGEAIVPEFIQHDATPERLTQAAHEFLINAEKRASVRRSLLALRNKLEDGGSSRAAQEILKELMPTPS